MAPLREDAARAAKATVLASDLETLATECCRFFDPLDALVLHGGYGRGEGTWYRNEAGWHPYNDYDLVVVTERRPDSEKVKALGHELAERLGLRWVDIVVLRRRTLERLRPTIFSYDLKYASTPLVGPDLAGQLVRPMNPNDLPLRELRRLFVTRLWTLLGGLDRVGLNGPLEGEASMFFQNQMAKAVLACADALLLPSGAYHPSYRCRVARVLADPTSSPSACRLFSWALEEKLNATAPTLTRQEVVDLYDTVHELFWNTMCRALGPYFQTQLDGAEDLAAAYRRHWETRARRMRDCLVRRAALRNTVVLELAQVYTAAAYEPGGTVNPRALAVARRLLRRVRPTSATRLETWEDARLLAASGRR